MFHQGGYHRIVIGINATGHRSVGQYHGCTMVEQGGDTKGQRTQGGGEGDGVRLEGSGTTGTVVRQWITRMQV